MKKILMLFMIFVLLMAGCGNNTVVVDDKEPNNLPILEDLDNDIDDKNPDEENSEINEPDGYVDEIGAKENLLLPEEYKNWDENTYVEMSMLEKGLVYADYRNSSESIDSTNIAAGYLTGEQKEALDMLRTLINYLEEAYPTEHFIVSKYRNISNNSEDRSLGADITFYSLDYLGMDGWPQEYTANITSDWVCSDNFYDTYVEPVYRAVFLQSLADQDLLMDGTVVDIAYNERIPFSSEIDYNYMVNNYPQAEKMVYMFVKGVDDKDIYASAFGDFVHNYNFCGAYEIYFVDELPETDEFGKVLEVKESDGNYFTAYKAECVYYNNEETDYSLYFPY